MMNKLLKILKLLFVSGLVIFVYGFSVNRNAHKKIGDINIKIENDAHLFITPKTVNKLLKQKLELLNSKTKDGVLLKDLETAIGTNKLIKKVDVFVGVNGKLGVLIQQKTPIARILSNTDSFYLDRTGDKMPLSSNFSASVPTISGVTTNAEIKAVYKLAKYIYDDAFLKEQIIGIELNKNKEFELFTRYDNAMVLLGNLNDLSRKLNNFKAFYLQAEQKKWNKKYKMINLKYSNQVVCTK